MEFLRYIIVFFVVGWGGGFLGGLLFFLTLPLLSRLRGTTLGRIVIGAENGLAVLAAVVVAFHVCRWTGDDPSYGMFALAFVAMVSNDLRRIRRAWSAHMIGGHALDENPIMRAGFVLTERLNMVGDLLGFCCGLAVVPSLSVL